MKNCFNNFKLIIIPLLLLLLVLVLQQIFSTFREKLHLCSFVVLQYLYSCSHFIYEMKLFCPLHSIFLFVFHFLSLFFFLFFLFFCFKKSKKFIIFMTLSCWRLRMLQHFYVSFMFVLLLLSFVFCCTS